MDQNLLADITVFVTAANATSFRATAKALDRQPSAVTAAIKRLEGSLMNGQPLFVRRATGTQLTPDGQRLLPLAESLLVAVEDFSLSANALGNSRTKIRVGTIQGAWHPLLSSASEILDLQIEFETVALDPYWPTQPLFNGDIDYALLPAASDNDHKLNRTPIFTEPRIVCVSRNSSIAEYGEATLEDFDAETWIGAPPGADKAFTNQHRCDDIRPGPAPKTGRYFLNPLDIGTALRDGEVIIGSMHSITSRFAGLNEGVCDVRIKDAPPWQVDLVTLRSRRNSHPIDVRSLSEALQEAATHSTSSGIKAI